MKELWARIRGYVDQRSPRERWLMVGGLLIAGTLLLQAAVISPLRNGLADAKRESSDLANDLLRAQRMARDIVLLRADLERVEERIKPGERTNLFTLLEKLAGEARMGLPGVEQRPQPVRQVVECATKFASVLVTHAPYLSSGRRRWGMPSWFGRWTGTFGPRIGAVSAVTKARDPSDRPVSDLA